MARFVACAVRHLRSTKTAGVPNALSDPRDGGEVVGEEVVVGGAEVAAAQKTAMRRQGRGMGRRQYQMARAVDIGTLLLGACAPEDEHQMFAPVIEGGDHGVGKAFPAAPRMAHRAGGGHGKGGVEQKYAMIGPAGKVAARAGHRSAVFALQLLIDVDERRRRRRGRQHRKAQPVRLMGPVVGILPDYHHLDLIEWGAVERLENELGGRVARALGVFGAHETGQFRKVGAVELRLQHLRPGGLDLDLH